MSCTFKCPSRSNPTDFQPVGPDSSPSHDEYRGRGSDAVEIRITLIYTWHSDVLPQESKSACNAKKQIIAFAGKSWDNAGGAHVFDFSPYSHPAICMVLKKEDSI
ncbi:hypothetical protein TNCV_3793921 [Trichonephila clavipes]|nr:hypothetical protein TNCV_3793921 [Trichonephila clavipes]